MMLEEIGKPCTHPAELSVKTDGKGNEKVMICGEAQDLGWLAAKAVGGIFSQVDDPNAVRTLDAAITMTIHLRAANRITEIHESDLGVAVKTNATPAPGWRCSEQHH